MIDPDDILVTEEKLPTTINLINVPEFEYQIYDLTDDKEYEKYIKDVESQVRRSFEYKQFIRYLRDTMGMNKCAFLQNVSNEETFDIKIELHHYPFSLRDIADIVFRKRSYYKESLEVQMVAKEVMECHYKLIVGIISLSETVHELAHSHRLFVPVDKVIGRYKVFVELYKPFIEPEMLETLERIEKYTLEHSEIENSNVIEQNRVSYNVKDNRYALPDMNPITDQMVNRLETIKANNYLLPVATEPPQIPKKIIKPLVFFNEDFEE
jgi:hypothetical protein